MLKPFTLQVRFGDNRVPNTYLSPDIRKKDPGWSSEEMNRSIAEVVLALPRGRYIVMSGMEKYNFFLEISAKLAGGGGHRLSAIYLLGKYPKADLVYAWKIDIHDTSFAKLPWGKEYNGTPTRGWKMGCSGTPNTGIVRA